MSAWTMIVIVVGLAVAAMLCYKESRRANRARLALRIVMSLIAVLSLSCMALQLKYKTGETTQHEIVIKTTGADEDSIRLFLRQKGKELTVVEQDVFLGDPEMYDSVHVFGYGLNEERWKGVATGPIVFHPASIDAGIVSADWNRTLASGEWLLLQGQYVNRTKTQVKLFLNGFNTMLDSVPVAPGQTTAFQLRSVPKQNGRAVFTLLAMQGKDTLEKEPVPVEVVPPTATRLMILAGSPDFENRFLKDWLSQQGYAVAMRTLISTNKSDRSVYNADRSSIDKINATALDSVDVLVSDEAALALLPASEKEAVYRAVTNRGMGLIIRGDTIAAAREWYTQPFRLYAVPGKSPVRLSLTLDQQQSQRLALTTAQPRFIRMQKGMQSLVTDSASNTLAAMVMAGAGKIMFTTMVNTYSWLLAGESGAYQSTWNLLLKKAGRQHNNANVISIKPAISFVDDPVDLAVETAADSVPGLQFFSTTPARLQDRNLPQRWHATAWPVNGGWQELSSGNTGSAWYVYGVNDWKYVQAMRVRNATEAMVRSWRNERLEGDRSAPSERPVSLFWFFLPFIISSSFLWAERKIS